MGDICEPFLTLTTDAVRSAALAAKCGRIVERIAHYAQIFLGPASQCAARSRFVPFFVPWEFSKGCPPTAVGCTRIHTLNHGLFFLIPPSDRASCGCAGSKRNQADSATEQREHPVLRAANGHRCVSPAIRLLDGCSHEQCVSCMRISRRRIPVRRPHAVILRFVCLETRRRILPYHSISLYRTHTTHKLWLTHTNRSLLLQALR